MNDGSEVIQAEADYMPLYAGCVFDAVFCAAFLHHMTNTPNVLCDLRRATRDGGYRIAIAPGLQSICSVLNNYNNNPVNFRPTLTIGGTLEIGLGRKGLSALLLMLPPSLSLVLHHPDDLDIRILKEFGSPSSPQWNVRESYSKVAKRVGVDEETVRKRVIRMRQTGSFPRWLMKPNPYLIGCQAATVELEVEREDDKPEAISKITKIEGVVTILDFLGKRIMVVLYFDDDAHIDRMAEQLGSILRGSSKPVVWRQLFPRPEIMMRKVDWQIMDVMADDARMDLQEVASRTGATTRTIQRRLEQMMQGKAFCLSGRPVYGRMAGLSCHFLVSCPDPTKKRTMDRRVLSQVRRMERSDTSSKDYSMFVVDCENPREADETLAWLRGMDGVGWVRMGITKEVVHVQDWLKAEVGKRASADPIHKRVP
jgi:DNA-binding Lrp family transcriptional regulator